ncbi:MAG: HAMP domain-containing protein [Gemmatimonadetes bacterium]|nr:HAMP domain-containing protein [Gemmatimonadota bacterium]
MEREDRPEEVTQNSSVAAPRGGIGRGLSRRLLVWFLLLSLIPLFGSNMLGYLRSQALIQDLVHRYLDALTQMTAVHVRNQVERHAHYLDAIAAGNEFLAAGIRVGRGPGESVVPGSGRGDEGQSTPAARMEAVANRASLEAYLGRKQTELGVFEALYLLAPHGEVVAWSGTPPGLLDEEVRPLDAAPFVVTASLSEDDGGPLLRLLVPVVRLDGTVAGYLGGSVSLDGSRQFFQIAERTAGSVETFIVDAQGRPLFVSHPQGVVDYGRPLPTPLVARAVSSAHYRDGLGVEVIGTSAAVPGQSWRVITEVPMNEALGGLYDLRRTAMFLALLFVFLVAGAAWFVADGIVAPVRRLVDAARQVARGHLNVSVQVNEQDEIGELGHTFNEMTAELARTSARVRELHQREIERAQQLATVGELASGVAHEIKNPVVGISSGLDMVKRRLGEDRELAPIIEEMTRQLSRIGAAVHDLLAFARPAMPTLAPGDANHILQRAVRLVQPAAERAGVLVDIRLDPSAPQLLVDEDLLCQALVNLLMNAVQATARDGHITASTCEQDENIEFRVADTGRGIPSAELPHIFKPFFTTRHTGTGLGLSITREIVERHGGRLDVESEVGKGSAFTVLLPVGRKPVSLAEVGASKVAP